MQRPRRSTLEQDREPDDERDRERGDRPQGSQNEVRDREEQPEEDGQPRPLEVVGRPRGWIGTVAQTSSARQDAGPGGSIASRSCICAKAGRTRLARCPRLPVTPDDVARAPPRRSARRAHRTPTFDARAALGDGPVPEGGAAPAHRVVQAARRAHEPRGRCGRRARAGASSASRRATTRRRWHGARRRRGSTRCSSCGATRAWRRSPRRAPTVRRSTSRRTAPPPPSRASTS